MTRETVIGETPASRATSRMVTRIVLIVDLLGVGIDTTGVGPPLARGRPVTTLTSLLGLW
jgi:hypothetical protein